MKLFSDCSGPCETCKIHYKGGCLAGHGDDDYVHADPEWIKQHLEEKGLPYPPSRPENIEDLTEQLLHHKNKLGPISILECRSGWRVFMASRDDDTGINLAYSTFNNDSFAGMLKEAIVKLDDLHIRRQSEDRALPGEEEHMGM